MPDGVVALPSGHFRWRVQVNGQRITGTAPTEIEAVRDRAQATLDAGGAAPTTLTVRELVAMRNADADHAESTATRRDIAVASIPATFMDREASAVTPVVVRALWRQMENARVGAHTIVKASHALSGAYQRGIELEMVATNPVRAVRPKVPESKRVYSPPVADVRDLLAEVSGRPALAAWVRFMAVIGARPGEICGIRWDDLNVKHSTVRIDGSINRNRNETPGKTGVKGHRDILVEPATFAALRKVERIVGCPWVFTHDGVQPWRPQGATLEIRRAITRINKRRRKTKRKPITMRPYALRHFAATQALESGVPVNEVAAMLGDNPATVLKVYSHAIPAESRASAAVAAVLDG